MILYLNAPNHVISPCWCWASCNNINHQNWIRRQNMKRKYSDECGSSEVVPVTKKSKITSSWHQFMKEYGKTDGKRTGIHAWLQYKATIYCIRLILYNFCHISHNAAGKLISNCGNPASFNKQASESYNKLSTQEKIALKARAESQPTKCLSRNKVILEGEKLFKRIQNLVSFIKKSLHLHEHVVGNLYAIRVTEYFIMIVLWLYQGCTR